MNNEFPFGREEENRPTDQNDPYTEQPPYNGQPYFEQPPYYEQPPYGAQPPYYQPPQEQPYYEPYYPPFDPAAERAAQNRLLFRLGLLEGIGLLGYLLMRNLFVILLRASTSLSALYTSGPLGESLVNACFTFACVGLPFAVIYLVLRRQKAIFAPVPLGGVYNKKTVLPLIVTGLGVCLAGSLITNWYAAFADNMGFTFYSYEEALNGDDVPATVLGLAFYIVQGALLPALVEEFAFRGVVMQPLRRFGDWFAIWTSALLFGLMHANMTQVPFAIIAGVALGYVATVSGSLWVSILVHFLNNLISVVVAIVWARAGEGAALVLSNILVYVLIGAGVIALVFYIVKNPAWFRLRPGDYTLAKKSRFFLSPTLLVAAFFLLCITAADIKIFTSAFSWAL